MNAEQIAARFAKAKDSSAILELFGACDERREEIRARSAAISDTDGYVERPAARAKALREGPAAIQKLDDELRDLGREVDYLGRLQQEIVAAHESALRRERAAAIPAAIRKMPGAVSLVRERLAALDEAVATFNALSDTIGQYDSAGIAYPWRDHELAELARLRADTWTPRVLRIQVPPGLLERRDEFEESFPLILVETRPHTYMADRAPVRQLPHHGDTAQPRARIYG